MVEYMASMPEALGFIPTAHIYKGCKKAHYPNIRIISVSYSDQN